MRSVGRAILACLSSASLIGASLLGLGLARSQADPDSDYLQLVKRAAAANLPDDKTLLTLGHGTCNYLSDIEHHTLDGVQTAMDAVMDWLYGTNQDKGHDSGVIVYAAAYHLCPENLQLVSAWRDS